jgi:uncharacterized protein with HEPN domain
MPHDPAVLLEDIRHAAQLILDATSTRSLSDYGTDELLRAAAERLFTIIGEALTRLERIDMSLADQISDRRKIIGFRNVLVHGYEAIDHEVVWKTIKEHLPILKQQVETLLANFGPP